MNQHTQEQEGNDQDQLLAGMTQLAEEAVNRDLPRLTKLHGKGQLNDTKVLASEIIGTLVPVIGDYIGLSAQLVTEHQQGIVELEDFTYQDMPRAMHIVLGALRAKGIVTEGDVKAVISLIGEGSDKDSLLSRADADLILAVLMSFKTLATQLASSKEGEEAEQARESLKQIDSAVMRVMEISIPPEPDESEDDEGDVDDEDEGEDESDEA